MEVGSRKKDMVEENSGKLNYSKMPILGPNNEGVVNVGINEYIQPFLYMPFKRQTYKVTEGWRYSQAEQKITGLVGHGGIDFKLPRGTGVLAAAPGWAISSYFGYFLKKEGKPVFYKNKPLGFGLGYFVQIYHPETKLYSAYGHLEKIAEVIRFHQPRRIRANVWPVGHKILPENLPKYKWATWVERGQVIGFVGDSGLAWGYEDFPQRPDPRKFPSWDEVHLHFEVFKRVGNRKKKQYFDPFGIKGEGKDYPDFFRKGKQLGVKSPVLWILDEKGLPKFLS